MDARAKPQLLCVDDEVRVVEGLALVLRKDYDVHTASSPEQALHKLSELRGLAVVISDMRMPKMDGAAFLQEVLRRQPDATRIVLTGQADLEETRRAVNLGQVFRILTKPCPVEDLKAAIDAAVVHHRLLIAERTILRETLLGCIQALMEVLAIANPVAFGRAGQIKRRAMELATRLGSPDFWQLEAAALLSQLGYVALSSALVEKLHSGQALTPGEQAKVSQVPDLANKLLEHIPRLDPVIQILSALKWSEARVAALGNGTIGLGTRILSLVLEYDALIAKGMSHDRVCDHLCAQTARFGPKLISQLDACVMHSSGSETPNDVPLRSVVPGMILDQEIRTAAGALIVPRGFQVTQTFLEKIANISAELLDSRVRVLAPASRPDAAKH